MSAVIELLKSKGYPPEVRSRVSIHFQLPNGNIEYTRHEDSLPYSKELFKLLDIVPALVGFSVDVKIARNGEKAFLVYSKVGEYWELNNANPTWLWLDHEKRLDKIPINPYLGRISKPITEGRVSPTVTAQSAAFA